MSDSSASIAFTLSWPKTAERSRFEISSRFRSRTKMIRNNNKKAPAVKKGSFASYSLNLRRERETLADSILYVTAWYNGVRSRPCPTQFVTPVPGFFLLFCVFCSIILI